MDINLIKSKRKTLEKELLILIESFEKTTGVKVDEVSLVKDQYLNEFFGSTVKVNVNVTF